MPEKLDPLTDIIEDLDSETLTKALKAAALHLQKRDAEIDADGVMQALRACGITSGQKKILSACEYLLKQAGKGGGQSADKLTGSLTPLGFSAEHISALTEVIAWVKSGALVEGTPPSSSSTGSVPPARRQKSAAVSDVSGGGEDESELLRQLHWAAITGNAKDLQSMLAGPASKLIDAKDNRGYTAYHHACSNDHPAVVANLVRSGCNTQIKNDFQLTGWRLAASLHKQSVVDVLSELATGRHEALRAEKEQIDADSQSAKVESASGLDVWTVKIGAADEAQSGGYTVYVVEVWGEGKRLSVSLRRYNEFYAFRQALLGELQGASDTNEQANAIKLERLPFPKKTDIGVMFMGKNSESVKARRIEMLSAWCNAALSIAGDRPLLYKFLGVSKEYIGVTIVDQKNAADYEAHGHLFAVQPISRNGSAAKGLSAQQLPRHVLFGCDETGVQLFYNDSNRQPIPGEGYPYHIIHSWSRCEPKGRKASVSLEFGQDQNSFELHLQTDEGEKICGSMRMFATSLATTLRRGGMEQRPTTELVRRTQELKAKRLTQEQRSDPQITHTIADIDAIELVLKARAKRGDTAAAEALKPPAASKVRLAKKENGSASRKSKANSAPTPAPAPAPAPTPAPQLSEEEEDCL